MDASQGYQRPPGNKELGQLIARYRLERDMRQVDLAERVERGRPIIAAIEQGRELEVPVGLLAKIQAALCIPPAELMAAAGVALRAEDLAYADEVDELATKFADHLPELAIRLVRRLHGVTGTEEIADAVAAELTAAG